MTAFPDPRDGRPSPVVLTNAPSLYDRPTTRELEVLPFVETHGLNQRFPFRRVVPDRRRLRGRIDQLQRYRSGGFVVCTEAEWDALLARGEVAPLREEAPRD